MTKKIPLTSVVDGFVNAGKAVATASANNNTTLRNGSTGSQVEDLQKALNAAGYDVGGVDGVYGDKTSAAVKQYQKDHGLAVDGIAGKDTLGSLRSSSSSSSSGSSPYRPYEVNAVVADGPIAGATIAAGGKPKLPTVPKQAPAAKEPPATKAPETPKDEPPAATPPTTGGVVGQPPVAPQQPFTYDAFSYDPFSYADYSESDIVKQANALLQQHNAAKPGAYQSMWQNQINDYMGRIENRDPFSYDFNSDALYQLYKDNYIQQGQMAMMDTMGQAAAMTGGYGNSYAQTVGQQAYNQQLSQLNNVIPELYQMAFDRYAYEGQQLQDMYNMYMGREEQDYGRYMDSFNAWQNERDYLAGRYDSERDYDYGKWETGRAQAYDVYSANKSLAYDEHSAGRDLAWKEYLANMEKEQAAAELMAGAGDYDRIAQMYGLSEDELKALTDANAPKGTGGGGTGGAGYDNQGVGDAQIRAIQEALGVTVDGKWGPESQRAAGGLSAAEALDAWNEGKFDNTAQPPESEPDATDDFTMSEARRDAIYDWLAHAYANAGSSFQPLQLIRGSSYLKTQDERDYAESLVASWTAIHKK